MSHWIHAIQGVGSDWVRSILQSREDNKALPGGLTIDQLKVDLQVAEGGVERWLNPAEKALRLMDEKCDTAYLHGNHDDYLIVWAVTEAAKIPKRHKFWETDGVLIEHGHRLEATLIGSGDPIWPTNYDGSVTGYQTTIDHYRKLKKKPSTGTDWASNAADWAAQKFQQPQYWGEFAQVWIGRQSLNVTYRGQPLKPPHVFVIGHTHMPTLAYINVDFVKFFG